MLPEQVSVGLAFAAGLVAFLSPCTLPLLPGYLGYLAARASAGSPGDVRRARVFLHGLCFVIGFTLLFTILGAIASSLGQLLSQYRVEIARIGGAFIVLFGISLTGLVRIPLLGSDVHLRLEPDPRLGFLYSFLTGLIYAAGWTTCTGPVLGIALTFAAFEPTLSQGMLLLFAFSLGLGLPYLLIALALDRACEWVRRLGPLTRAVQIVSGLVFAAIGLLLMFNQISLLAPFLPEIDLGF
jgi:cytochrome c-type biogenesis protein